MVERVRPPRQDVSEGSDERIRNVLMRGDRLVHGRNSGHIRRNVLVSGARLVTTDTPVSDLTSAEAVPIATSLA